MAHEYAKVNVAIWGDQEWKQLKAVEQWLYFLLWTHPKTNAAGVSDWNPARLAKHAGGLTAEDVQAVGERLQARRFILIDDDEVLIRSYIKHDQRMKQPNAAVSVANAYSGTASVSIQKVVVHELRKLSERHPEFKGWGARAISDVLSQEAEPIDSYIDPSVDPRDDPSPDPSVGSQPKGWVDPSVDSSLTETYTETSSKEEREHAHEKPTRSSRKKPETRIPDDWQPTEEHHRKARTQGVDLDREAENFRLHAEANDRRQVNWNAAFTMWLNKARPGNQRPSRQRQTAYERELQISAERHERIIQGDFGKPIDRNDPALWTPRQIGDGS